MNLRKLVLLGQRPANLAGLLFVMAALTACTQPITLPVPQAPAAAAGAKPAAEAPAVAAVPVPTDTHNGVPVGFTPEGYPFRGDPNAPVTLIEYSDYECPFCARYFVQTEPAINEAYVRDGKVRVIFRDFPIVELHPNAPAAHIASLCVAEQGAVPYWEMHDQLFRTQSEWGNATDPAPVFERLATETGIDIDAFKACLEQADAKQALIDAALEDGRAAGVSGTPSFQFVSSTGEEYLLVGAQPFEQFAVYADALIAGEAPPVAQQEEQPQGEAQIPFWATAEGLKPDPDRPGFTMAGDAYRGNADAKVQVIEFSDFQCPFCGRHVEETQPALDSQFVDSGEIMWVFKHFPLSIHPQAPAAGIATECAAEQGKFWEMHEALFASVQQWSVSDPNPVFVTLAEGLDLDAAAFESCLADPAMKARVDSDMQDGAPFVQGTPTFIVLFNGEGRIIPGALPVERFSIALQEILDQVE